MGDLVLLSVRMHRPVLLLLLIALSGVFGRKFCPRERNGDKCRAKDNTFKCGVFFYNLIGQGKYQYLAELPQALHKTSKEHWQEILGSQITLNTFNESIVCDPQQGARAYNSRCYGMFSKIVTKELDSCDRNVLVSKSDQTVGDYLCGQVRRWLKNDASFKGAGKGISISGSDIPSVTMTGWMWGTRKRVSLYQRSLCAAPVVESLSGAMEPPLEPSANV